LPGSTRLVRRLAMEGSMGETQYALAAKAAATKTVSA
jgi:hypothetical protein